MENIFIHQANIALIATLVCYYAYYFTAFHPGLAAWISRNTQGERGSVRLFLTQKFLGFLCLGLIPFIFNLARESFDIRPYPQDWLPANWWPYSLPVLFGIILGLAHQSALKKDVRMRLPQMRLRHWGFREVLISIGGWGLYLLGYEYLFRGWLLFATAAAFGEVPAILINLGLYSAFHLPNGRSETLAALPFGFVLCLISLHTGHFLWAFTLHLSLSAAVELFSVHYNPDMHFGLTKIEEQ